MRQGDERRRVIAPRCHGSGQRQLAAAAKEVALRMLPDLDALFAATVQATEEAIVNALAAGSTMRGADGNTVHALPHDRVRALFATGTGSRR